MIALSALTEQRLRPAPSSAIAVLALAGGADRVGFFAVLFAARSSADADRLRPARAIGEIERGDLEAEVPVYDGTEIGLLQAGFNRMAEGLRERERIRELFGMHVGEEVARGAMDREGALGGRATRRRGPLRRPDRLDDDRLRAAAGGGRRAAQRLLRRRRRGRRRGGWLGQQVRGRRGARRIRRPRRARGQRRPSARRRPSTGPAARSRGRRARRPGSASPTGTSSRATSAASTATSTR